MTNRNSSNINIPEAREAGSVGGQMVKKMSTIRTANYTRKDRTAIGHEIEVRYIATITI